MSNFTPLKKFVNTVKDQLSDIASISKKHPHHGSPQCLNSLKRMQKIVSQSGIRRTDKQEINYQLESIERSLSAKKNRRRLSSTEEKSDRTHKYPDSILKVKDDKQQNSSRKPKVSYEIRELQMRNRMLEEQIESYKLKVKQARKLMIYQLKQDEDIVNLDYVELDETKKETKGARREIRELIRQNNKLKQLHQEKDQRISQLQQQNKKLKLKLQQKNRSNSKYNDSETDKQDEIVRLTNQIKRLKIQKKAVDKKDALISNNQKLRDIVKRYKSYL